MSDPYEAYNTEKIDKAIAVAIRRQIELEGISPKELGMMAGVNERLAEREVNRALDYPGAYETGTYARLLKALDVTPKVTLHKRMEHHAST